MYLPLTEPIAQSVSLVSSITHFTGPTPEGKSSTNVSINCAYPLMSQQTRNKQKGRGRMTETGHIRWNQAMKEARDGNRRERSLADSCWCVYLDDITLLQMVSSTQRKRERAQQKDVSCRSSGTCCQGELIIVYFMTCTFNVLHG